LKSGVATPRFQFFKKSPSVCLSSTKRGHINQILKGPNLMNVIANEILQVLLVERNVDEAEAISHFLTKKNGCQVKMALDATSGLAMTHEYSFDLILMDIELPDGNGDQIALQIRQDALNPNQVTPIIAMATYTSEWLIANWRKCGISKVYVKPF
jgi:DNA-binding response OmpR family regulator